MTVRLYLSNDSYPELREVRPQWVRTVTWWRAIARATRTGRFWLFASAQVVVLAAAILAAVLILRYGDLRGWPAVIVQAATLAGGLMTFAYLQVSWGGDMMRSHLRAVSDVSRYSCPSCGQSLFGHLDGNDQVVRCPECGCRIHRDVFAPPFRIPREFRVFPPWGGSGPL